MGDPRLDPGVGVSVAAAAAPYPRTYASPVLYVKDGGGNPICRRCAFRPWDGQGVLETVTFTVVRDGTVLRRVPATLTGGRWVAPVVLAAGELAFVERGGGRDDYREMNGAPSRAIGADGVLVDAPTITEDPDPVVPEAPLGVLLPLIALAVASFLLRRRTAPAA